MIFIIIFNFDIQVRHLWYNGKLKEVMAGDTWRKYYNNEGFRNIAKVATLCNRSEYARITGPLPPLKKRKILGGASDIALFRCMEVLVRGGVDTFRRQYTKVHYRFINNHLYLNIKEYLLFFMDKKKIKCILLFCYFRYLKFLSTLRTSFKRVFTFIRVIIVYLSRARLNEFLNVVQQLHLTLKHTNSLIVSKKHIQILAMNLPRMVNGFWALPIFNYQKNYFQKILIFKLNHQIFP